MIKKSHKQVSVRKQCVLLSLHRSGIYYRNTSPASDTLFLLNRIAEIYQKTPQYGYRRVHAQLVREGHVINRKRVQRFMKESGLQALYPKPKTTIRGKGHKVYPYLLSKLHITRSHQVWQVDITYFSLGSGYAYLVALIDVYSRAVVGWRLSNTLCSESSIETLSDALWRHGSPDVLNSDQGTQFTSQSWEKICLLNDIKISMSHKGGSTDNAYIERLWRTIKYEGFYLEVPSTMSELKEHLKRFIDWYNEERLHSSLSYKTPMEVLKMAQLPDCGYMENRQACLHTYPQPQQQNLLV